MFRVTGLPAPSPGLGVTYNIPVRYQRAIHQAMVESGCMQDLGLPNSGLTLGVFGDRVGLDPVCAWGSSAIAPVEIRYKAWCQSCC